MSDLPLKSLRQMDGFCAVCLLDSASGLVLAQEGDDAAEIELAATGTSQMLRAQKETLNSLGLVPEVEHVIINLSLQVHLLHPLTGFEGLFIYAILDRSKTNIPMALHQLKVFEQSVAT